MNGDSKLDLAVQADFVKISCSSLLRKQEKFEKRLQVNEIAAFELLPVASWT